MHSANIVEEVGYPVMIIASDGDTVLDEKNVSPIKAQHSESINCISKLANSETKFTETNRLSNHSRKIPETRDSKLFMEKLSVKNCYVSDIWIVKANNCLQESLLLDFVMIQIIHF